MFHNIVFVGKCGSTSNWKTQIVENRWARLRIWWNTQEEPEMLAASICCEIYYTVLPSTTMTSRVPRCLFGKPDPRETMEMFQEALDAERSKFAKRWGVDPCSEDKENNYQRRNNEKSEPSTNKKRSNPYSRQTSIHGEQHFSHKISTRILLINLTKIKRMLAQIRDVCMSYKAYLVNMSLWTIRKNLSRMHVPGTEESGFFHDSFD